MSERATRLPWVEGRDAVRPQGVVRGRFFYWFRPGDGWYLYVPGVGTCSIRKHQVTEHEDGSITASPSILVEGADELEDADGGGFPPRRRRHGHLQRGVWQDVQP